MDVFASFQSNVHHFFQVVEVKSLRHLQQDYLAGLGKSRNGQFRTACRVLQWADIDLKQIDRQLIYIPNKLEFKTESQSDFWYFILFGN